MRSFLWIETTHEEHNHGLRKGSTTWRVMLNVSVGDAGEYFTTTQRKKLKKLERLVTIIAILVIQTQNGEKVVPAGWLVV